MKLVIPGTLPSLNEMINASKRNKYEYVKMKDVALRIVALEARAQFLDKVTRADFEITWYCPNKRKDKDNVAAGQKFIFDGLQLAGIIGNDGWKQIRNVTHRFEIDKQNPRVEIEIEEVSA